MARIRIRQIAHEIFRSLLVPFFRDDQVGCVMVRAGGRGDAWDGLDQVGFGFKGLFFGAGAGAAPGALLGMG